MKISLSWLKEFIALPEPIEEVAALLTRSGLEVEHIEAVEQIKGGLAGLVIGQVLTCGRHPNADKLSVTTVDVGAEEQLHIVCGAPNVAAGQKVIVATVGAMLYPNEGEPFQIKKSKIRGEASEGMICAEDEIGLGKSHDGIMVLETALVNGTPAAKYFNLENDYVLEIGLTPNRSDAASHFGVARDLRALLGRATCIPQLAELPKAFAELPISVVINDNGACPRYAGLVMTGVKVGPSPEWLQKRLKSIGLNPINNIVDCTNYILHGIGQPLHAFDYSKIAGSQIIVQKPEAGTQFITLDGATRTLNGDNLMICDAEKPLAIAGVFGGAESGITAETNTIFIESAYFQPASVRKTAQHFSLKTDASFRYERGTDPNICEYALLLAATLIAEIAGGAVASAKIDIYPTAIQNREFEVKYAYLDTIIGTFLDRELIHSILNNLDIATEVVDEGMYGHQGFETAFKVSVPPYRVDVTGPADIAEEIIRIYGIDNIPLRSDMATAFISPFPKVDNDTMQYSFSNQLAALGYVEMMNNSLCSPVYSALTGVLNPDEDVDILNPISEELSVMRQSLLFSALQTVLHNVNRRQQNLKLFEFGKVYRKKEAGKYEEERMLSLVLTGNKQAETWLGETEASSFHQLLQVVNNLILRLRLEVSLHTLPSSDMYHFGLELQMNKRRVGVVGLVNTAFAKHFEVKQPVYYAELHWEYLLKKYKPELKVKEISKFPEVRRDLSLVLNTDTTFADVERIAFATDKKLLQKVNVFDVYQGENLGEGKKSYSVSYFLQDTTQTLNDAVIDGLMDKLIAAYEKQLNAIIRK
jgi:phenylalanyl-tRNA synthetase beta chain